MDLHFVIRSAVERDEETGMPLYWSNSLGWVTLDEATVFNSREKNSFAYIPNGGVWVTLEDDQDGKERDDAT